MKLNPSYTPWNDTHEDLLHETAAFAQFPHDSPPLGVYLFNFRSPRHRSKLGLNVVTDKHELMWDVTNADKPILASGYSLQSSRTRPDYSIVSQQDNRQFGLVVNRGMITVSTLLNSSESKLCNL